MMITHPIIRVRLYGKAREEKESKANTERK